MDLVGKIERGVNRLIASAYHRNLAGSARRGTPRRRSFDAADTGRLFYKWTSSPQTADEVLWGNLTTLRARSRDSFHNNDFVRRYVNMVKDNIVGPKGVVLQARALSVGSGEPDRPANQALEEAWARWSQAENCDFKQRLCWQEMQRQAIGTAAIDGEIIAHLAVGSGAGPFAFMVNHIDAELLDPTYNEDVRGNRIRMGIEYDKLDRRVAYHFLRSKPGPDGYRALNGRTYQRVPANEIIHAFLPEEISQNRGYPWTSTSLARLKMLDAYFDAATTAARAGASKMGFITSQDGEGYVGDAVDGDGAVISEFEAGIIEQLSAGQEFHEFDPKYPHEQFGDFVKSCLLAISGSLGVSYAGLSGDLQGTSFASGRVALLDERESWKRLQDWFVESYCRPIFNRWLLQARLTEQITVFGKPLSGPNTKYMRVSWQPRRWAWVDPQKDQTAKIEAAKANMGTISAGIREQGQDPDEVFEERAQEKIRMKELGLVDGDLVPAGIMEDGNDGSN